MKVVVSSQGGQLDSPVDGRFGRAKYFVLVDTDTGEAKAVDNSENLNALQGAGVQAAKKVADLGAETVVATNVGPKAFSVLSTAGVRVFSGASGTVAEAIEQLKAGQLSESDSANVQSRWT
ncbi:MAG: NifB/NifX family molybdenum-iron cluster-binding protein [Phycisphaerae bacterium]